MRELLDNQLRNAGDDVRRVLRKVLDAEQSKIDIEKPRGIVSEIKMFIDEETKSSQNVASQ